MPTVSTNKPVKRDGRNSKKRLEAARLDAERSARKVLQNANNNAFLVLRLIQASDVYTSGYPEIRFGHDPKPLVEAFLGVNTPTLAKLDLKPFFKTLWDTRFDGSAHDSCKARALSECHVPAWYHLVGTSTCVCCGRKLGCEHKRMKSLSQEECHNRKIYHAGRCYSVSECLDCGDIHAVDSSD